MAAIVQSQHVNSWPVNFTINARGPTQFDSNSWLLNDVDDAVSARKNCIYILLSKFYIDSVRCDWHGHVILYARDLVNDNLAKGPHDEQCQLLEPPEHIYE